MSFKKLAINQLVKAEWNYKEEDYLLSQKLFNNIKKNGFLINLIVRDLGDKYEVVNGNHRLDVLNSLGVSQIVCYDLGKISELEAKKIAVETNETSFKANKQKVKNIIKEINESFELDVLKETLPFADFELDSILNEVNEVLDGIVDSIDDTKDVPQRENTELEVKAAPKQNNKPSKNLECLELTYTGNELNTLLSNLNALSAYYSVGFFQDDLDHEDFLNELNIHLRGYLE